MKRRLVPALCALLFAATMARPLSAQIPLTGASASDGISVLGTGELVVQPNWVEVDLSITGSSELTGDALVKYRDSKKRVEEALTKLGLADLTTSEVGLSISAGSTLEQQQRMMQGMPQQGAMKNQIDVSSTLRVTLKGIRDLKADDLLKTVGRLLDVAQDSGVTIGPTPRDLMQAYRFGNYNQSTQIPVRFVVADLAELREKAYERAVTDARSRASRLAKLNGVKLGTALSVQEVFVSGDQPAVIHQAGNTGARVAPPEPDGAARVVSPSFSGIGVQVKLLVRFAIAADGPATAQK